MYILKNAARNITRSKGRNILIGIIIIVISAACAITLAIRESANKIVKSYVEKNPFKAEISMNRNKLMESLREDDKSQEEMINAFNEIKSITEEEVKSYGDSKYVDSYYYTLSLGINGDGLTEATDSLVKETTTTKTTTSTRKFSGGAPSGFPGGGPGGYPGGGSSTTKRTTTKKTEKIYNEKASKGAFTLVGYNSYEDMKEFINGEYKITDGEVNSDFTGNYAVISEELATLNEIKVGDTIKLVDTDNTKNTYELTVTGIYKENSDESNKVTNMFSNSANKIITNTTVVKTILEKNEDLEATVTPTYILKDMNDADMFASEVKTKGLGDYYEVTNNVDDIKEATSSITNVKNFATTFLIVTLVIGSVVLIVINMINIRERKYEIGVLRTIGMKKIKVAFQFMMELLIVALVSLSIGAAVGAFTSVPIANNLLKSEISNAESKYEDASQNFGMTPPDAPSSSSKSSSKSSSSRSSRFNFGQSKIEKVNKINAVVNIKVLGELLGIGVLLTLLSSLASMVAISRFSPLTILKERS
ncbi:MAG: FtsX-like permease family protein [Bacilli bacterium]|nr:FtsX-like permease family protein [Bacilli bacterium]